MPLIEALGFFHPKACYTYISRADWVSTDVIQVQLSWTKCPVSPKVQPNTSLHADSLTMACQCCTLRGLHCCCSLLLSIQYHLGLLCQGAGGGGAVWSLLISLDSLCLVCVFLTLSLVAVTPPFSAGAISVHPISLAAVAIGKRRVVGHDWHCTVGTWCASKASLT